VVIAEVGANSWVYTTTIPLTGVSSIDYVVGVGHGIIGEAIMRIVDLPNSFMHPADEAGQRTETVRIFRAAMDAR
jgi:hypothetical protein